MAESNKSQVSDENEISSESATERNKQTTAPVKMIECIQYDIYSFDIEKLFFSLSVFVFVMRDRHWKWN